jgi:hypothetical protein
MAHSFRSLTSLFAVLWLLLGAPAVRTFELKPTTVAPGVYALIGPTGPRTAQADCEPLDEVIERLADASQFSHLANFHTLHRSNINRAHLDFERGGD